VAESRHRWGHPLLAAVVTAVIGGIFTVVAVFVDPSEDAPSPPDSDGEVAATPTTSSGTLATTEVAPSSPARETREHDAAQWGPGLLLITSTDLDSVPPRTGGPTIGTDVQGTHPVGEAMLEPGFDAGVAAWTRDIPPSAEECQEVISTQGRAGGVEVQVGSVVCVGTGEGRVAMVTVESIEEDGILATIGAQVTVWGR
jgi:hypothetical protein